jgi:uncharacterized protein (TIGR02118 family)
MAFHRERIRMYKHFALWTAPAPADVDAFESYYLETHVAIAAALPGLQRLVTTRTSDSLGDDPSPYFRIAELWWEDQQGLEAAKESPEFEAAIADVVSIEERFGVTLTSPAGEWIDVEIKPYDPAT